MATKSAEVTKQDELMEKLGYSKKGIEYFKKKLNFKELPAADVKGEQLGHCGDYMSVSLKVNDKGVITDAVFEALGCAGACISGSSITIMIKGKTLEEAKKLDENDIVKHLGSLPQNKVECAQLAVKALKNAIKKYEKNSKS
ncbi:iron-sulfur cluster assembly scaffold protein [Patescibacteria group bacterium]